MKRVALMLSFRRVDRHSPGSRSNPQDRATGAVKLRMSGSQLGGLIWKMLIRRGVRDPGNRNRNAQSGSANQTKALTPKPNAPPRPPVLMED